ncbi:MAG: M48 family metallopeptidase [Acidobacteria bacterium]|nr:M48 family metallopeptidase [Acidobacteriota bacterium]MBV9476612.1 M48 family metallopeptidase [Acidobacteriota bacterium]
MKCIGALLLLFAIACSAFAAPAPQLSDRELPPGLIVPEAAKPGPDFDVERATQAYLDVLTPEQRAKSDAYFEGGYWLELWGLLYGLAVAALLLFGGLSRRMRDAAQRVTRRPFLSTWLYVAMWLLVAQLLELPLAIYSGYFREHQYGLSTLTFGGWLREGAIGLGVSLILVPPLVALLYVAARKAGERWWVWASGIMFVAILLLIMIAPVAIAPLFNKYTPLPSGTVRDEVLSLARANRIPATNVYLFDASKQTTRVSANVSGMLGTTRVSLNDNLLARTSLPEIRAVLGHEMGHYVLNHPMRLTIYLTLVVALGFFIVHRALDAALRRWGSRWGAGDRTDPAALPAAVAIFAIFFFFATPLVNTITRQAEAEADAFGMNAAREPHGFATVAMRLSTYRKLNPGPLEEILFYDHPSGADRVRRAMTWLKENQNDPHVLASMATAAKK